MNLAAWITFGVLTLLTLLWFILVRRDARAYIESQVKVLGEEHRAYVDTPKTQIFFGLYGFILVILLGVFFVYFLLFS